MSEETQKENHDLIFNKIDNLTREMNTGFQTINREQRAGFDGVHTRQDTANGRTGKIEAEMRMIEKQMDDKIGSLNVKIGDLEKEAAKISQKLKNERIIWALVVVLVGIIAGAIGNIINGNLIS